MWPRRSGADFRADDDSEIHKREDWRQIRNWHSHEGFYPDICVKIATAMRTAAEIAIEMGCSRQAINNAVYSSLRKIYKSIFFHNLSCSPFDAAVVMMHILGISKRSEEEIADFFESIPRDIRIKIVRDGMKRYGPRMVHQDRDQHILS